MVISVPLSKGEWKIQPGAVKVHFALGVSRAEIKKLVEMIGLSLGEAFDIPTNGYIVYVSVGEEDKTAEILHETNQLVLRAYSYDRPLQSWKEEDSGLQAQSRRYE